MHLIIELTCGVLGAAQFTVGALLFGLLIGVIIFFFGVSFLRTYAAPHNMVPIMFRLAGVASEGRGC